MGKFSELDIESREIEMKVIVGEFEQEEPKYKKEGEQYGFENIYQG